MSHAAIKLEHGSFDFDNLPMKRIAMWHFAPRWPDHPKARLSPSGLSSQLERAYRAAVPLGRMVLWMPSSYLHCTSFDPLTMAKPWNCFSTVMSGSDRPVIGYVYSTNADAEGWGNTMIWDAAGRGPSSSVAMKFILDRLCIDGTQGFVVDPYAHRDAILTTWCRRWNIPYWGRIRGKKNYANAAKVLEQVELPAIQTSLLSKGEGKQNG